VDMDLEPFARINPCGMVGMQVTQLRDLGVSGDVERVGRELAQGLARGLAPRLQLPGVLRSMP
jgi:lipoyl(octanoyl) transferase